MGEKLINCSLDNGYVSWYLVGEALRSDFYGGTLMDRPIFITPVKRNGISQQDKMGDLRRWFLKTYLNVRVTNIEDEDFFSREFLKHTDEMGVIFNYYNITLLMRAMRDAYTLAKAQRHFLSEYAWLWPGGGSSCMHPTDKVVVAKQELKDMGTTSVINGRGYSVKQVPLTRYAPFYIEGYTHIINGKCQDRFLELLYNGPDRTERIWIDRHLLMDISIFYDKVPSAIKPITLNLL